jgi:hypothetical protein
MRRMSLQALNSWRWIYLAEALIYPLLPRRERGRDSVLGGGSGLTAAVKWTLLLGASLWLVHDLAHGRWRIALADAVTLAALCFSRRAAFLVALAAISYGASHPERPPSPFVWARFGSSASRGTS